MILTYVSSVKVPVASSSTTGVCTWLFKRGTCKEHVALSADIILYYQLRVHIHKVGWSFQQNGNSVKPKENILNTQNEHPVHGIYTL